MSNCSIRICIPYSDGIKACLEALTEFKVNCPSLPDPNVLVKLLEVVLTMNTFEFNSVCYQQLQGCAMGNILVTKWLVIKVLGYLTIDNNIVKVT